jgi:Arc/MetJ-type ribon-helix-helix transcriptional regulator
MPQWTVRLPDDLAEMVQRAAKDRGFSSPRGFIRDPLRKELHHHASDADNIETRLVATLERLMAELRRVETAQQAQFALTDALAKLFLVCVPEPPPEVLEHSRCRAMARYEKFVKNVAASMAGGARAALAELVKSGG